MSNNFVHLHTHSHYSMLDGYGKPKYMIEKAKKNNMPAMALTDHANLAGIPEFHTYCIDNQIKPIVGCELYLAYDHLNKDEDIRYHILLLATNQTGYKNLLKLATIANKDGFYHKPRIDFNLLQKYSEGLITTTGCMASQVNQYLLAFNETGDLAEYDKAKAVIEQYIAIFGTTHYFVELQEHHIPELTQINQLLIKLAEYYGLKTIITNDSHYVNKEDANLHNIMLCVQTGSTLGNQKFSFPSQEFYIKTPLEIIATFADYDNGLVVGSMRNTLAIADMVETYSIKPNGYQIPKFCDNANAELEKAVWQSLDNKGLANNPIYVDRLNHELSIIKQMNFADYFLIIADLCAYAKQNKILFNARGSGAGSLVCWLIGITAPNPIQYGLLFERFLNPHRVNMPDIDLDFSERNQICEYIVNKYGNEYVAQIMTANTMKLKGGFKDILRVNNVPYGLANELTKVVDNSGDDEQPILDAINKHKKEYPDLPAIYQQAKSVEGTIRQSGIHAAGILITPLPLVEYCHHIHNNKLLKGIDYLSSLDMKWVEELGLLKVDLLGLETLNIVNECMKLVNSQYGKSYSFGSLPIDTPEIYQLLSTGKHLDGVFQVEGDGMGKTLAQMKPSNISHIVALLSLYRPGPMQYIESFINRLHGKESVAYDHPLLEGILKETFGIMVYQEQITMILSTLAQFSMSEADMIRRAIGKKKPEVIAANKDKFIAGCQSNGVPTKTAQKIWDDIVYFERYGFNKSHSVSYAILTCKTAYLKANYPLEWYVCLLNHCKIEDKQKYLTNAQKFGLQILPPSFDSEEGFTIKGQAIQFGLAGVKHLGKSAYKTIKKLGSLGEALQAGLDKRILEALIYAGMLDGGDLGIRYRLVNNIEFVQNIHKFKLIRDHLLDFLPNNQPNYDDIDQLTAKEVEYLGMSLGSNELMYKVASSLYDLTVWAVGKVTKVENKTDKNSNQMAFVYIDNERYVVFYRSWVKLSWLTVGQQIVYKADDNGILQDAKELPHIRQPLPYKYS